MADAQYVRDLRSCCRHTGRGNRAGSNGKESVVMVGMMEGSLYALPTTQGHSSTGIATAMHGHLSLPLKVTHCTLYMSKCIGTTDPYRAYRTPTLTRSFLKTRVRGQAMQVYL